MAATPPTYEIKLDRDSRRTINKLVRSLDRHAAALEAFVAEVDAEGVIPDPTLADPERVP